jgi:ribosomal protein S18 acetylase RimI-like enzyme
MAITYGLGSSKDLELISSFLEEKTTFPGYLGFEEPDVVRKVYRQIYRVRKAIFDDHKETPLYIARDGEKNEALGYMLLAMGVEESITEEMDTQIFDIYARQGERHQEVLDKFLEIAQDVTRKAGVKHLITEIKHGDEEMEGFFSRHGFQVELNRILKRVGTYTFDTPRQKKTLVRPARNADRMFILLISSQNSGFLIPSGRETDSRNIRNSYYELYSSMDLADDPCMKILLAEDVETFRPCGYIMVQVDALDLVSSRPLAYLYDLSVHKDYWGKYVGQRLVKEAENYLAQYGVEYLIGDTAENNRRPLMSAIKTLNFKIFNRRWVKKM